MRKLHNLVIISQHVPQKSPCVMDPLPLTHFQRDTGEGNELFIDEHAQVAGDWPHHPAVTGDRLLTLRNFCSKPPSRQKGQHPSDAALGKPTHEFTAVPMTQTCLCGKWQEEPLNKTDWTHVVLGYVRHCSTHSPGWTKRGTKGASLLSYRHLHVQPQSRWIGSMYTSCTVSIVYIYSNSQTKKNDDAGN